MSTTLLITPPFTQLNTPYPATAYLKGYLNSIGRKAFQVDLGIEVINELFSSEGLRKLFNNFEVKGDLSENASRIYNLKDGYVGCIDYIIGFLRQPNTIDAQNICYGDILPEASRFNDLSDDDAAFGSMGVIDKAKHYCTLMLEDLSDYIVEAVDPNFGFSRYAERLARCASRFDEMYDHLSTSLSFIEKLLIEQLQLWMDKVSPQLVAISVPFPGNMLSALRIGQWVKNNDPDVKVSIGGGFVNTELRSLNDSRVFEFCDFITLDDGEMPIACLLEYLEDKRDVKQLKRTFIEHEGIVEWLDGAEESDVHQKDTGIPDYSDINWHKYISVVEVANPMFRLWSDGAWLKLTLAHGCYWGKCSFCDGSLDYIKRYESSPVKLTVDRIEAIIQQTQKHGFHFVDEAASPAILKELALEIIRRRLNIVWWTNIRFEKSFSTDLCLLLKQSGCVAVAGGLEVASPRILKLINKGVTLEQVANVASNLTNAGIMVHAYLMYGFPGQTAQETIDSLEVVRQLFEMGVVSSAFWHQFALTAHSPVGLKPDTFNVQVTGGVDGEFANNDLQFVDIKGVDHGRYGEGLKKALYNYMHGVCFDFSLSEWFDFKVPATTLPANYIDSLIHQQSIIKDSDRIIWLGKRPVVKLYIKKKGKRSIQMAEIVLNSNKVQAQVNVKKALADWLNDILPQLTVTESSYSFERFRMSFEEAQIGDFDKFIASYTFMQIKSAGLLII